MFVLRSAAWLALGFFLVAPHGTDFGAAASAVKDQAIAAGLRVGEQIVVNQLVASPATVLAAVLATPSTPSVALPMQDPPTVPVVFPRRRPAAMG